MFVSIVRSHLLCRKDLGTGSSNHILPFAIGLFFIAEIGGTKQFMSRKKKNRVYVGLDGLDIKVNTTKILEQNYYIFLYKKAVNPKTNCFVCMDMKLFIRHIV